MTCVTYPYQCHSWSWTLTLTFFFFFNVVVQLSALITNSEIQLHIIYILASNHYKSFLKEILVL